MSPELTWCPQCHSPLSTVVVRDPVGVAPLVGGALAEDRVLELLAQLSAREPTSGPLAWVRRNGQTPSAPSRILLSLGGIGAVLLVLLTLMWVTGLAL